MQERFFKFELHQTNKLDVVFDSNYASSGFDISSVLKIGATLMFYSDSVLADATKEHPNVYVVSWQLSECQKETRLNMCHQSVMFPHILAPSINRHPQLIIKILLITLFIYYKVNK